MKEQIRHKINNKTKPLGSLGMIEKLAEQICLVQNTLSPSLKKPCILVFAADHGLTAEGVSAYPAAVTAQMVLNFLNGGAAINVFCNQHHIDLKVVDSGVNFDFASHTRLIDAKTAMGTKNMRLDPAMSKDQLNECFTKAKDIVHSVYDLGCNIIGFGEMGIGNTSSASLLMSTLCNIDIEQCIGRGTGLDESQLQHKLHILKKVIQRHPKPKDPQEALQFFGGFEIAQICGGMLTAYEKNMLILVDGFIATASFLCAYHINPKIMDNAIFCHKSDEQGHQKMLEFLDAKPILDLGMRLGEGTGCAMAYPIVQSAVNFVNEMASFDSAGVSQKL
jgi:nicotinate-nucleotide--dimethylbenzimidazole phosphoribosyltransferase